MCIHDPFKYESEQFFKKTLQVFSGWQNNFNRVSRPNFFSSVKTKFWLNFYGFSAEILVWPKTCKFSKMGFPPISDSSSNFKRSGHIKYLQFLFTNNTISCIIQSTFYRCEFCWNWCDPLILFIIFLRRCLYCFTI